MPKLDKHAAQGLAGAGAFFALLLIFLPKVFFTLHFLELAVIVAVLLPHFFRLEEWANKRSIRAGLVLAVGMTVLSVLLTNYDQFFFQQHLIESVLYVAILLLMFFRLEEWAYALGIMTPVFWILLAFMIGRLGDDRGIQLFDALLGRGGAASFLASFMFVGGIGLFAASTNAYRRVIWGTPRALLRLAIVFVLVGGFYSAMAYTTYKSLETEAGAAEEQTLEQPAAVSEEGTEEDTGNGGELGETEDETGDETPDESE